jgi:hypothetical protein
MATVQDLQRWLERVEMDADNLRVGARHYESPDHDEQSIAPLLRKRADELDELAQFLRAQLRAAEDRAAAG